MLCVYKIYKLVSDRLSIRTYYFKLLVLILQLELLTVIKFCDGLGLGLIITIPLNSALVLDFVFETRFVRR